MHDQDEQSTERSLVSTRTMDIVVALLLIVVSGLVIADSIRIGVEWREIEGPAGGYFPFRIALILAAVSVVNLLRAAFAGREGGPSFVSRPAFRQVLSVLVPLAVYVLAVSVAGIYVSSAIYIALFMWYFGHYHWIRGLLVGSAISIALFLMFEIWFLVPLAKGPLEDFLGY